MLTERRIRHISFLAISCIVYLFIPRISLAEESAEDYLKKIRVSVSEDEIVDCTLKALELEPAVKHYFFEVSLFDYIPSKEIDTLSSMHLYLEAYFEKSKDYASVLAALKQAASAQPDNPDIRANLAYLYLMKRKSGGLKDAFNALSEALRIDPSHRNSLRYLYALSHEFPQQDIEALLSDACRRKAEDPYAYLALGMVYYKQDKLGRAIQAYKKACELDPDNIEAKHALGRLYLEAAKREKPGSVNIAAFESEALALFSSASELAGEREDAILKEYYDMLAAGNDDILPFESREVGLRQTIIDGNSVDAEIEAIASVWILRLELANYWFNNGSLDAAEGYLQYADAMFFEGFHAQRNPYDTTDVISRMHLGAEHIGVPGPYAIRYRIARRYDELGDRVSAMRVGKIKIYEQIRENKIDNLRRQGLELFNKPDLAAAQSCYRQAIALGSGNPQDYLYLANIAYKLGDYSNSAWARGKYIAMTGEDKAALADWVWLAYTHALRGDYKSAARAAREARSHYPSDNGLFEWLAVFEYGAYGWDAAARIWEEKYPGSFEIAGRKQLEKEDELLNKIYSQTWSLAETAEGNNNLYAALKHYSVVFSILKYRFVDIRKEVMNKIVEIYQRLPLKLNPPAIAVRYALEAEMCVDRNDLAGAGNALHNAVGVAPWWPQARYNLALFYGAGVPEAVRQMEVFLRLDPSGPNAAIAREKISGWQKILREAVQRGAQIREDLPFLIQPDQEGW